MENEFKVGDKVKFKSSESIGAEYFENGLEGLEIKSYDPSDGYYRVWESDKSAKWWVNGELLMLDTNMLTIEAKSTHQSKIDAQKAIIADAQRVLAEMLKAEKKTVKTEVRLLKDVPCGWYKVKRGSGDMVTIYKQTIEYVKYISNDHQGTGLLVLNEEPWENNQVVSDCEPFDW